MSEFLLQKGDIVRLEKGMSVYTFIPEKFSRCSCSPFSNKRISMPIEIGEILSKHFLFDKDEFREMITEKIQSLIKSDTVTDEAVANFIESLNLDFSHEEFDTSIFAGEYIVCNVTFGGNGSDKSDFRDFQTYSGWKIYCEKIDNPDIRVYFFRTGKLSTTTSRNIKVIRYEN